MREVGQQGGGDRRRLAQIILAIMAVAAMLLPTVTAEDADWDISTIDSGDTAGPQCAIAYDLDGAAYVVYNTSLLAGGRFTFATNADGQWAYVTLENRSPEGAVLAVDEHKHIHVLYGIQVNNDWELRYATNASGIWSTGTVRTSSAAMVPTSVAVDASGTAFATYRSAMMGTLNFTMDRGGAWSDLALPGVTHSEGSYSAVTVDREGHVHIAYHDGPLTDSDQTIPQAQENLSAVHLFYATDRSGSLAVTDLSGLGSASGEVAIAVNSTDAPLIAYLSYPVARPGVASMIDWIWTSTNITSQMAFRGLSLAIDDHDHLNLAYETLTDVVSATNASGAWRERAMELDIDLSYFQALAVDPAGRIHLVNFDANTDSLDYLTTDHAAPVIRDDEAEPLQLGAVIAVSSIAAVLCLYMYWRFH